MTDNHFSGVGDFGDDHGWWGRPENQDAMTEDGRGGWRERPVRRIMGTGSIANQAAFDEAVAEIEAATQKLIASLTTTAAPKDREEERAKARARNAARFRTPEAASA